MHISGMQGPAYDTSPKSSMVSNPEHRIEIGSSSRMRETCKNPVEKIEIVLRFRRPVSSSCMFVAIGRPSTWKISDHIDCALNQHELQLFGALCSAKRDD